MAVGREGLLLLIGNQSARMARRLQHIERLHVHSTILGRECAQTALQDTRQFFIG